MKKEQAISTLEKMKAEIKLMQSKLRKIAENKSHALPDLHSQFDFSFELGMAAGTMGKASDHIDHVYQLLKK